MSHDSLELLNTDVLVLGGGQSGLVAALEARRAGARVVVVSKGWAGRSGASAITAGTHSAVTLPDDSPEQFTADILKAGQGLADESLARTLANGSVDVIEFINKLGVEMAFDRDLVTPGNSMPRRWKPVTGRSLEVPQALRAAYEQAGGEVIERASARRLLTHGADVVGAVITHGERTIAIEAPTTILATGGYSYLYANTDNPADVTGDGISMAIAIGAEVIGLEFVQFYPYQLTTPRSFDVSTKLFSHGAQILDKSGRRIMDAWPRKELSTRDVVSREITKAGDCIVDISGVQQTTLDSSHPKLVKLLERYPGQQLQLAPVAHTTLGGIKIDSRSRTTVSGLLACGECTGGVHGANRLGGNALTEAVVFGQIAGREALQPRLRPSIDVSELIEETDFGPVIGVPNADLRSRATQHLGVLRSSSSLRSFLEASPHDATAAAGLLSKVAHAALARPISIGTHQLTDEEEQQPEAQTA